MPLTQAEFTSVRGGHSQADRILARLRDARGAEVPMPELALIGSGHPNGFCMVHSRIADLRKRGHNIPPATVKRSFDGQMLSFYRLIENQSALSAESAVKTYGSN